MRQYGKNMRRKVQIRTNIPSEEPIALDCELDEGTYIILTQNEVDMDKSIYSRVQSAEKDSRRKGNYSQPKIQLTQKTVSSKRFSMLIFAEPCWS
jgi:hypothetical protein